MKVNYPTPAPVKFCTNSKPGLYVSAKGTHLIMPCSNSKGNGILPSEHVLIVDDVDTGHTFVKKAADVKGEYTFVCDLEDISLDVESVSDEAASQMGDF